MSGNTSCHLETTLAVNHGAAGRSGGQEAVDRLEEEKDVDRAKASLEVIRLGDGLEVPGTVDYLGMEGWGRVVNKLPQVPGLK